MPLSENSLVCLSREATYGTYIETNQVAIPVESYVANTDVSLAERDELVGTIWEQTAVPTRKARAIELNGKLYPGDEIGNILFQMLGAATTTGAGSDKTHVFNISEAKTGIKSLCAEIVDWGNTAEQYDGIMFNTLTIEGSNEGFITFSVAGMAQGRGDGAVMSPIVITTVKPYRFFNAAISYGGGSVKCDSWSISIDMALRLENFKTESDEIYQPVIDGKPSVTATLTFDAVNKANRAVYEAGTATAALVITLTHSENIPDTETKYSLKFQLPATQITSVEYSGETGQKKETLNLKGFVGTATSTAETILEATLVNGTAAYA